MPEYEVTLIKQITPDYDSLSDGISAFCGEVQINPSDGIDDMFTIKTKDPIPGFVFGILAQDGYYFNEM